MSEQQHPSLSPERVALRASHGVRVVTKEEEGHAASALPAGVYGFTGAPAAPEMPVFAQSIVRSTEVHKLANGETLLIGYVRSEEAQAFASGDSAIRLNLFPEPREESKTLVAVPLARIDARHPPTRENGNSMAVEIAPK